MKVKISDIKCPKCLKDIEVETDGWAFGYTHYPAGCDCCSDDVTLHVDIICPECGKYSEVGLLR